jgi:hypothetical protein
MRTNLKSHMTTRALPAACSVGIGLQHAFLYKQRDYIRVRLWGSRDEISRDGGGVSRHTRDEWDLVDTKVWAEKFKQRDDGIPRAALLPETELQESPKKVVTSFTYENKRFQYSHGRIHTRRCNHRLFMSSLSKMGWPTDSWIKDRE